MSRPWARFRDGAHQRPFLTAFVAMGILVAVGGYSLSNVSDGNARTARVSAQRAHVEAVHNRQHIAEETRIIRALHADLFCVERWSLRLVDHLRTATSVQAVRVDRLIAALSAAQNGNLPDAERAFDRAKRANRAYHRYVRNHPIPAPALRCRLLLPQPPPPRRHHPQQPTPSPQPTATVTRTVTVPGPTVTRTVTVTEPPGKHRGRQR